MTRTREELLLGVPAPRPARVPLRCGPVTAVLDGPDLRAVRRGGRELAQRVYVAVRDEVWGTVPGELSNVQVEQGDDAFRVTFTSRHRQGAIDVEWQGEIVGEPDGTVSFAMDAVAHSAFRYAKIGFNLHHPLLESVGRRYRAATPDGLVEGRLEREIEPQRVVDGKLTAMFAPYSALALEYGPGQEVDVAFEGDLFELQDHRNWADGNFKSYGTPLSVPWPMDAEPGQRFRQRITVRARGLDGGAAAGGPVRLRLGDGTGAPLPPIGLQQATSAEPLADEEAALVALARPAHLRVPVRLHENAWPEALAHGLGDARRLGAAVELAVSVEDGDDDALRRLAEALGDAPPLARVLVLERQDAFTPTAPITRPESVARARAALSDVAGGARFAGGSDQFFSDVNRAPPAVQGLDAVCFGISPQVHAADDASLMENLPALADIVATSRAICPGLPVAVSPVTLAPRLGPYPGGEPGPGDPPASADRRGLALFGASWTLGALTWLAEAGAESVTLYETSGPAGVVARGGGAYPVLHVLADLAARPGAERVTVERSDPLAASALALRTGDGLRVLVANHTPEPLAVELSGLPAAELRVRALDETTASAAMAGAPAFVAAAGEPAEAGGGVLALTIAPYGVARVDA